MKNVRLQNLLPWVFGKNVRVAVIGDMMIDEYLDGEVSRISPEAPIPVHRAVSTKVSAGGAANAAKNIALAGGNVDVISVIGNDDTAKLLQDIFSADGINGEGLILDDNRRTIRKLRIRASNQQIVRIDWEDVEPINQKQQDAVFNYFEAHEYDAVLISDYGKGSLPIGLLARILESCRKRNVPSIVDPKGFDYSKYLHASLITPNKKEACQALGIDEAEGMTGFQLGQKLQKTFGLRNVLVTLGPAGMALVSESGEEIHRPAVAKEVWDVSGAGDTVAAMMTLGLASRASWRHIMEIATVAAGIVVEKWGTQPVRKEELIATLTSQPVSKSTRKILDRESLAEVVQDLKRLDRKIVFTNGCFDILHAGHVTYIEEAKKKGNVLILGINSDESISRLKGPQRPIIELSQRMKVISALESVDFVIPFDEDTPKALIELVKPDVLIKGSDYNVDEIVGADFVAQYGGIVQTIDLVPGTSTSGIIEKIAKTIE